MKGRHRLSGLRAIFPRLQIRAKLLIAFIGLSVLPVLLVGLYAISENIKATERNALENLAHDVRTTRGRASNFLSNIEGDLRVLLNSTDVERYVNAVTTGTARVRATRLQQLSDELLAFARTKRLYYQIRVVSEDGEEALRVESNNILDSIPHFSSIPPDRLRHSGETYYFLLAKNLHQGEIVFAPVELGYRGDQRLPVLSFATPLFGASGRVGLLIVNVFAGGLFNELEAQRNPWINEKVVLVSSDGHYLYSSDERGDWNKLIASRQENNLQKDYPPSIAQAILSGREGIITEKTQEIIGYAPLMPVRRPALPERSWSQVTTSLFVFESVPRASITRDARASTMTFAGFLILFFGGALVLGLLATRQFTRPIAELQRGAEIIARGKYRHRLNVKTGDEIETLAHQFNAMAFSLEEHEREILEHRIHLEEMVNHRTRELTEQKKKLQAVLDNVPSAFVMLDGNGRIQTASAAFASITGLSLAEAIGREAEAVFRSVGLCQSADFSTGAVPLKVESHIDRLAGDHGSERYLEHMTIPITEDGQRSAVLQIITDVTKRKRLEEHLIRSEKLMATGEMAAIIAHGFRNSLTSIKMILQLQQESKRQEAAGKRSLAVALDSISRMESVVQELLDFARPSPMVFALTELNPLVEQALALVRPRLKTHHISVRETLDQHIPLMMLDARHVRETILNLLVNAFQAIEGAVVKHGTITVRTRRVVLSRTLREYPAPVMNEALRRPGQVNGQEIVLRKGRECVIVTVADNGSGIDRAVMRRILDPFFTTKTNGTGLGLPMAKRSVNAHGGILLAKSNKGKGATFEIVLPLHTGIVREPSVHSVPGGKT
jgi:PAS domain S-box-containing protein